ncbi:hypothetical protein HOY80DRAFT_1139817 [Tuber brumale]|nr:hypothetical protein HOY80DRAFT_1139817 [Tuber brumale]
MTSNPPGKPMPNSSTTNHFPEYKDFLFGGTVALYVGRDRGGMEIHKKLLASISPELDRHVNDMREGAEGIVCLPDEGEEMLTLFTEWAYTGEYGRRGGTPPANPGNHTELKQNPWPSLHKHLQLCVFSDKFNIPILKQLAESKFYTEISPLEPGSRKKDGPGLVMVIGYAYDNLPSSDPILTFLARYASWKLKLLRPMIRFNQLILARPELLKELLMNLEGPNTKPIPPTPQTRRMIQVTRVSRPVPVGLAELPRVAQ